MKLQKHHYFYLFVGFLFLGIVSVELFSDGMFLDGLMYAGISRNMAEGMGSFWKPFNTYTLYPEFYEHPPLALGLQSLWFWLFGDSIYVERFYSLSTFLILGYLIVLIWGKFTNDKKTAWIPLLFWILIGGVSWSAANNLLENTMSIFIYLSFYFYLISIEKKRLIWVLFSGFSLSLALLSKGFVCLYIWSVPFFFWLFKRKISFWQMLYDSFVMVFSTIFLIAILYFFIPEAQNNMLSYFNRQVVGSIENIQTVDTRFAIVFMFLKSILIPFDLGILIILIAWRKKLNVKLLRTNLLDFLMILAIVLAGILPIMISMKQRAFYILSVYPLFAIGLAYYLYPIINELQKRISEKSAGFTAFKYLTLTIMAVSLFLSVFQINKIGRDKELVSDTKAIIEVIGENKIINICPELSTNWSLHAYFMRYGHISLDYSEKKNHQYFLTTDKCKSKSLNHNYFQIPLDTDKYRVYKYVGE